MPWNRHHVRKHTRSATTDKQRAAWVSVANEVLDRTGNEGRAVRSANAAVKRMKR